MLLFSFVKSDYIVVVVVVVSYMIKEYYGDN